MRKLLLLLMILTVEGCLEKCPRTLCPDGTERGPEGCPPSPVVGERKKLA